MSERADAWLEAAEYAASVAGVGEAASRDRGVPVVRLQEMKSAFALLRAGDPDAFYVCVNEYATSGAQAVADLVAVRARSEAEREDTNPNYVPPAGEVKEDP